MKIRKVLYPTDFSEASRAALPMAEAMAKSHSATIVAVHVYEPELVYGVGMAGEYPTLSEDMEQNAEQLLHEVKLEDKSIPVERRLLQGSPASSICDFAKQTEGVDLIVMSTHGRSGLSRLVMGSVAEAIVRSAPCPVLTLSSIAAFTVEQGA